MRARWPLVAAMVSSMWAGACSLAGLIFDRPDPVDGGKGGSTGTTSPSTGGGGAGSGGDSGTNAGQTIWSKSFGDAMDAGVADQTVTGVAVDGAGNVFVAGAFEGSIDFGCMPAITVPPGVHGYLVKLGGDGSCIWQKPFLNAPCTAVAADAQGNVIVAGTFSTSSFSVPGDSMLLTPTATDAFVAGYKPDATGSFSWKQQLGGMGDQLVTAIVTKADGTVLATGSSTDTMNVNGSNIVAPGGGGGDFFVQSWSVSGTLLGGQAMGGLAADSAQGIAVSPTGVIALAGSTDGTVNFGVPVTFGGATDAFVARYATPASFPAANALQAGDNGIQAGHAVSFGPGGTLYFGGSFQGHLDNIDVNFDAKGKFNVFIARLDATNAVAARLSLGDEGSDQTLSGMVADKDGDVIVIGTMAGSIPLDALGGTDLPSTGGTDAFVGKLDPTLTKQLWFQHFGDDENQGADAVAVDGQKNVIVAGHYAGSIDFGGGHMHTSHGGNDVFIVKLTP